MEREAQTAKTMTRRSFLKSLGIASIGAVGFEIGIGYLFAAQGAQMHAEQTEAEAKAKLAIESGMPLEVKFFAGDIKHAGEKIVDYRDNWETQKFAAGFFTGIAAGDYVFQNSSFVEKGLAGVSSMAVGRTLDVGSTLTFAQYMQDPRFKQYGFEIYIQEQSPSSLKNPNTNDILRLAAVTAPILAGAGFVFPALGEGYAGMSPLLAIYNTARARVIKKCLELGDGVGYVINEHGGANEVRDYLNYEVDYQNGLAGKTAVAAKV